MMATLERQLTEQNIPFDCNGNRVRCFPHVVNIAVKAGLAFLTQLPPIADGETDDDGISSTEIEASLQDNPNSPTEYRAALESDLISRVRQLVNACRASGNRRHDFKKTVLSTDGLDTGNEALLERVVVLLRDVDTRWSSTFLMVDHFLELYPAIERFIRNDPKLSETAELFSTTELQVLDDIRNYLFTFHSIQELASAEKTPTLSIVLP
ncbi:hypothetical protein FB446DRAFT_600347, partial [Lentinula raphanica]